MLEYAPPALQHQSVRITISHCRLQGMHLVALQAEDCLLLVFLGDRREAERRKGVTSGHVVLSIRLDPGGESARLACIDIVHIPMQS